MNPLSFLERIIGGAASSAPGVKAVAQAAHQGAASAVAAPIRSGYANTVPVGQALTPQNIQALPQNIQGLAQIYNQNPQDPRVQGIDPSIFGYQPDNTQPATKPFQSPQSMGYNTNAPYQTGTQFAQPMPMQQRPTQTGIGQNLNPVDFLNSIFNQYH